MKPNADGKSGAPKKVLERAVRVRKALSCTLEDSRTLRLGRALASDISVSGLRISTEVEIRKGDKFSLTIRGLAMPLTAEVRWFREVAVGVNQAGLQFVNVTPEMQMRIESFVSSLVRLNSASGPQSGAHISP